LNHLFLVSSFPTRRSSDLKRYWDYWKNCYEKQKDEIDWLLKNLPIKVRFFSSDDFDFKAQKENKLTYTPSVSEKTEWAEVFLKRTEEHTSELQSRENLVSR